MRRKNYFYIIIFAAILSAMLAGSVLLPRVAVTLKAYVRFSPSSFDLSEEPPETWTATIKVKEKWRDYTKNIDGETILVEGVLRPVSWELKKYWWWYKFYAYFDGKEMKELLWQKVLHMGLTPGEWHDVYLTVTGKLTDGREWSGVGTIKVYVREI